MTTTTTTTTTTNTDTTTTTTTTTTTAEIIAPITSFPKRITGNFAITVSNPQDFINDAGVVTALRKSLATTAKVLEAYIAVILKVVQGRRRLEQVGPGLRNRRLATGSVQVDYTITLPAQSSSSASAVTQSIEATSPAQLSEAVTTELSGAGLQTYLEGDGAGTVTAMSGVSTVTITDGAAGTTSTPLNIDDILAGLVQSDDCTRPLLSQVALFLTLYLLS
jgi:hypothetical protein